MKNKRVRNMVQIGMLAAVATVLMLFEFPLWFAPPFYELDFSEVPVLVGAFSMGPAAGFVIEALKIVLKLLLKGSSTMGVGDWANLLIAAVGSLCAASYFSLYFFPWFKYSRYLSDIRSGRSHECDVTFLSVSDQTTLRDGVAMHDVEVCVGDDPEVIEDHRLFFWDDDKPFPALKAGTPVRVRAFGNYIIGLSER